MPFYKYRQNNSGGVWQDDMPQYLIVEAENHASANYKAEELGVYFDGCASHQDCQCCGDRWYKADRHDAINKSEVQEMLSDGPCKFFPNVLNCRVHFTDGTVRSTEQCPPTA